MELADSVSVVPVFFIMLCVLLLGTVAAIGVSRYLSRPHRSNQPTPTHSQLPRNSETSMLISEVQESEPATPSSTHHDQPEVFAQKPILRPSTPSTIQVRTEHSDVELDVAPEHLWHEITSINSEYAVSDLRTIVHGSYYDVLRDARTRATQTMKTIYIASRYDGKWYHIDVVYPADYST